jgi:hypothetical protein
LLKTIFWNLRNTAKEAISCLGNWQRQKEPVNKPLKITYFDPICSTWVIQPVLRKLKLCDYIDIQYHMVAAILDKLWSWHNQNPLMLPNIGKR